MEKIGLFLQVRLNSTRMPGKALLDLHGKPLIIQVMERLMVIPAEIRAVLTSVESLPLLKPLATEMGWEVFTGSTQNVLQRFAEAAIYYDVDVVIRATGDNPLLSSEIALETLGLFKKRKCDLAYLEPIPYGSGVEVISKDALLNAYKNATTPYQLEHVTPYIYQNKDKFKIVSDKPHDDEIARNDVRITIDTREDYEKVNYMFRDMAKNFTNVHIKSVIKEWDSVKFKKYRQLLFAIDSCNTEFIVRAIMLSQILKEEFNIFITVKDISYSMVDTFSNFDFSYIDYKLLDEYLAKNGTFDRVIVVGSKWTNDDYSLLEKSGPIVGINNNEALNEKIQIALYDDSINQAKDNESRRYNYMIKQIDDKNATTFQKKTFRKPKHVAISIGEPDFNTFSRIFACALNELDYEVTVITPEGFKDSNCLFNNCRLSSDVNTIFNDDIDLIITNFSTTFCDIIYNEKPVIVISTDKNQDEFIAQIKYKYSILNDNQNRLIEQSKNRIQSKIAEMESDGIFGQTDFYAVTKSQVYNNFYTRISNIINDWIPSLKICPYCCDLDGHLMHRATNWNMYNCPKCGLIYTIPFFKDENIYVDNYFTEEYKSLYGKTYEEDRENIRAFAKNRMKHIKSYISKGNLLDFGCGLGFFAEYAQENGFTAKCVDISEYAINYIQNKLHIDAEVGDTKFFENNNDKYDVISMFYIIEHIKEFEKVIFMVYQHLNEGGVIAMSTPNAEGVSIKKNFEKYANNHPNDHYRIFSPKFMKKILKKYNFKRIKVVITGIHPQRMLKNNKLLNNKFIIFWIKIFAKIFRLGDTFEIYAQK